MVRPSPVATVKRHSPVLIEHPRIPAKAAPRPPVLRKWSRVNLPPSADFTKLPAMPSSAATPNGQIRRSRRTDAPPATCTVAWNDRARTATRAPAHLQEKASTGLYEVVADGHIPLDQRHRRNHAEMPGRQQRTGDAPGRPDPSWFTRCHPTQQAGQQRAGQRRRVEPQRVETAGQMRQQKLNNRMALSANNDQVNVGQP